MGDHKEAGGLYREVATKAGLTVGYTVFLQSNLPNGENINYKFKSQA